MRIGREESEGVYLLSPSEKEAQMLILFQTKGEVSGIWPGFEWFMACVSIQTRMVKESMLTKEKTRVKAVAHILHHMSTRLSLSFQFTNINQ